MNSEKGSEKGKRVLAVSFFRIPGESLQCVSYLFFIILDL